MWFPWWYDVCIQLYHWFIPCDLSSKRTTSGSSVHKISLVCQTWTHWTWAETNSTMSRSATAPCRWAPPLLGSAWWAASSATLQRFCVMPIDWCDAVKTQTVQMKSNSGETNPPFQTRKTSPAGSTYGRGSVTTAICLVLNEYICPKDTRGETEAKL